MALENKDNHRHTWSITNYDTMIQANNTDVFKSDIFRMDNIEWVIELYPNGDVESCNGSSIVLLRPVSIPTAWHQIRYCRRIKCEETQCSNTAITQTINAKQTAPRCTGWDDDTMSFNEFKQVIHTHNRITFHITIHVLQVSLPNDHILNVFESPKIVQKQQTLRWRIDSKYLQANAGQVFESDIHGMWCIKCSSSNVYLQLCSLPHHISSIEVHYVFQCLETNTTQQESDSFSFQHQNSGPDQFITRAHAQHHALLTIVVHIKIIRIHTHTHKVIKGHMMDVDQADPMDDRYKGALMDLIECIKKQTQTPRYNRQSNKLQKLKQLVQSRYPVNKIVIEQDHVEGNEHLDKRAIVRYLEANAGRDTGDILIKCEQRLIAQSDALEIFKSTVNERNPALVGQRGLRAKLHLAAGTVIGQYFGKEYLENEFDDIYSGTQQFVDINEYALSTSVLVKMRHSRLAYYTNTEDMRMVVDENEVVKQEFNIVIDGLNRNSSVQAMLIYMNDCRKDINTSQKTVEDQQFQNLQLVTVNHNGWPKIFGITVRNIKKGAELLTFYGKSHVGWEQDRIRYEQNQKLLIGNIQQVLRQHNIVSLE